ncbi:LPP20 family lipoprotein [Moritella sp. Urea-trap-13]|uniref:LPP20 family lipoprotein n=1 Tax=Moritella sp. Urea-trap-13 TaxID=2058327 RepID=UPI000C31CCE7|nr:LPP20 family lipoprotein [Moritella sp. Urea-trap-13]PKH07573.1 hypothetical protein CXF93_06380 [Moritella sp. Urea-trap-13]
MKKIILISAITLALAGCATTNKTVEETQSVRIVTCNFPDSPAATAPAWICDVLPSDLAAGGVGYSKKSAAGMSIMRKIAINNARVQLASQFEIDVSSMFKQAVESTVTSSTLAGSNEDVLEKMENVTKSVVSRTLANSKLIVSQATPTGGLYVLVGMDQATYDANLNKVIDGVTQDSKLWGQFNNEKAAADLSNALQSLKAM